MRSGEKTGAPVVKARCSANRIFLKNVLAQNSALCYNGKNKREAFGMEFRDTPMQNLVSIREKEVCAKVREMLLEGESLVAAYKTALPEDPAFWYSDDGLRRSGPFLSADGLLCRPA